MRLRTRCSSRGEMLSLARCKHHLNNISQTCVCHTRAATRWHAEKKQRKHRGPMTKELFIQSLCNICACPIKTLWLMCRSNWACGSGLETRLPRSGHPSRVWAAAHHRGHEEFLRERLSRWTAQPLLEARRHAVLEKVHRRPRHFQNVSFAEKVLTYRDFLGKWFKRRSCNNLT